MFVMSIFAIGTATITVTSSSKQHIMAARILNYVYVGMELSVIPVFQSEIGMLDKWTTVCVLPGVRFAQFLNSAGTRTWSRSSHVSIVTWARWPRYQFRLLRHKPH